MKEAGVALAVLLNVVDHRRQNALFSFIAFKISVQFQISYQSVSYGTRKRPCFHFFSAFQFFLNTVRLHHLTVIVIIFFL